MSASHSAAQVAFLDTYASTPEGMRTVYCDGSSSGNSIGHAGWAWYCDDTLWQAGGLVVGSNSISELMALGNALAAVDPAEPLLVVSDSQYAINAVFAWWRKWSENNWLTSLGTPVANAEHIQYARTVLEGRKGRTLVKHVRGHGKDPDALPEDVAGNKVADMLAAAARAATKAASAPTLMGPSGWDIVHGRGRKKNPFLEHLPWEDAMTQVTS